MGTNSTGPVAATGPASWFSRSRERAVWAVALVVALVIGGGGWAYAAAAVGDQVVCPPGVSLEVRPDGTWRCMDPAPSPTVVPTSPSPSMSPTATQPPTPSPTVTQPTPSPSTSAPAGGFPTATSVGVPAGWTPTAIRQGDWPITQSGVYTDVRVNGSIDVRVAGVTLRRVQVVGGVVNNVSSGRCYPFTIEDSSVIQGTTWSNAGGNGAVGVGGYTARRVAIVDRVEGFRVGGRSDAGCGATLIEDSYVRLAPPRPCGDWHGDALQGYDAPPLTIRNTTLDARTSGCGATSAFFYGDERSAGNAPSVIRGLLVAGGGYPFRTDTPSDVEGLRVLNNSWAYGPVEFDVTCDDVTRWVNNAVVTDMTASTIVRPLTC